MLSRKIVKYFNKNKSHYVICDLVVFHFAVKNGVTMSLQNVIPVVMTRCFQNAILTLDLATHWCHVKSQRFLASWSVEQFLLILHSDVKVRVAVVWPSGDPIECIYSISPALG